MFGVGPNLQTSYYATIDEVAQLAETSAVAPLVQSTNALASWATDQVGPGSDHNLLKNNIVLLSDAGDITALRSTSMTPVAANPGGATTTWINSSAGNALYFGSTNVSANSGNVSSNITSVANEVATYTNTTGQVIGKSNLIVQNETTSESMYIGQVGYADISNVAAVHNLYIKPNNPSGPSPLGGDNTVIGYGSGQALTTGSSHVLLGVRAGSVLTTQSGNTMIGDDAGVLSTGSDNTYIGNNAGTTAGGSTNVHIGSNAGSANGTTCSQNVILGNDAGRDCNAVNSAVLIGHNAGRNVTTNASSVIIGRNAVYSTPTGVVQFSNSIAIGNDAGSNATTNTGDIYIDHDGVAGEANVTRIGTTKTKCFIAGIRGRTTDNADAVAVLVDSAGQLGTVSSSRVFKENIKDLNIDVKVDDIIQRLRPVSFNYIGQSKMSIGLIAEEVELIYPEMCIHNPDGSLLTVDYARLPILNLDEVQRLKNKVALLEARVKRFEER